MEKFITSICRKYRERRIQCEEQWPPVRGDRLINLQLVEAQKEEGFRAGLPQHGAHETVKRTPIFYCNLFQKKDVKKQVRKIIVEGNAGIGKTTLCTMLAEGWAEGKILTQFDCVLLFPLRDSRVSSATSLPELFKLLHAKEKICTAVVENLEEKEGEGVLIIADGWDELSEKNHSKDSYLYDLLFGSVLPFASVLLTSRPSASAPLHNLPSVDRLVEVVGFNEENVKQYILSEFEKNPEKAFSLIEEVENNPVIQSVCTVPLNCAIVCNLWHTLDQSLPRTLTQLYTKIVLNIIFRNIKKKFPESSIGLSLNNFDEIPNDVQNTFWLICEFAYECLLLDQLVFSEDELATRLPDVGEKLHCFGLLQSARSLLPVGHGLSFHFAHLTIQEFLAALHLATLSTEKKLEVAQIVGNIDRFDMVWRFVFGLGGEQTGMCSKKVNTCIEEQLFEHFVKLYPCEFNYKNSVLYHLAYESLQPHFATRLCNIYNKNLLYLFSSTSFDCVAYFHVLRYMTQCDDMEVVLSSCGLTDKLLKELTEVLSESNGKLKISRFSLDFNKLTTKGITNLSERAHSSFSNIRFLELSSNNISNVNLLTKKSCIHLFYLDLSHNPLGVTGIQSLETVVQACVLSNLSDLFLSHTLTDDVDINEALLTTLLPSLASHCLKLRTLDISDNNLSPQGLCTVMDNIPLQLKQSLIMFSLRKTLVADICCKESPDLQLQTMDSPFIPIHSIDVSGCNFNRDNCLVLAKFLLSSKKLNCSNCSLTSADIVTLMNHLKTANVVCENLTKWTLKYNKIDEEGVSALIENVPELFPGLKKFGETDFECINLHDNPGNEALRLLEDSVKTATITEWRRSGLPPQDEKFLRVFYKFWDTIFETSVFRDYEMNYFRKEKELYQTINYDRANNYVDDNVLFIPQLSISDQSVTPAEESPSVEESVCSTVHTETLTTEQQNTDESGLINTESISAVDQQESVNTPVRSSTPSTATQHTDDVTLTMKQEDMILKVLVKAQEKYYFLSKEIGLEDFELTEIENKHLPDKLRCLYEMLKRRIRQGGLTRSMLCQSLRGELVGRDDIAQEIEALKLT